MLIWNKIPVGIRATNIGVFWFLRFFGFFLGFYGILISDSESASNLEFKGGGDLNGSDPILGH